ncbi:MAG: TRAP transporter substrate-binding protein [Cyanobacteria bacterium J06641_5]
MQRRHLLRNLGLGTTGAIAATACQSGTGSSESTASSPSRPRVKWRMVTSWPPSLDTIHGGAELLAERIDAMTDGRFTISVYAAGEIVPALNVLDAVQAGTVECGHTSSYYYIGKNPSLAFGTSVPFGLNAQQQNAWFYHGGGLETMHDLYSDFNILSFPAGNTGTQMGGWFKQEIQSLKDLQGLKMRIPGLGGTVMTELGVNVQVLPAGDVFLSLDRNTIDAAEFVGPYDDEKLGLHKAAPFYYYPGWWEPGPTLETLVNRSAWDKLPGEYQEVFTTATKEVNQDMLARYDARNLAALQRLREGGTQLRPYSPEILQAAKRISDELLATNAAEDATFRKVYDSWQRFRDRITQWHEVAEFSYARFTSG